MSRPPWALRCPEGHANLDTWAHTTGTVRCQACGTVYDQSELVDLSKGAA